MDNMFADLIPQQNTAQVAVNGNPFADLIPKQPPPQQPIGVGEDVAKSFGTGVVSSPMWLGDLTNAATQGITRLAGAAYQGMGGELTPEQAHALTYPKLPFFNSSDVLPSHEPQTGWGVAANIAGNAAGALAAPKTAETVVNGVKTLMAPKPPAPSLGAYTDTLINGSPDIRTYAGQDLGQKLQGAEQAAWTNKDLAYKSAEPALEKTSLPAQPAADLSSQLTAHAAQFDSDLVPASKLVKRYASEIASQPGETPPINDILFGGKATPASNSPITLDKIELLRKKLNNIPINDNATGKLVGGAKQILDENMDQYVSKGIVNGDPDALKLISDARSKNAYWRQKFTGDDANTAIKKYIDSVGGSEQIAPENLLDMFTRVGQTGLDNVKAAKSVLGKDADPILKTGFVNKIRSGSIDANGDISPLKLAKQIDTLMTKNPSLMNEVFTPSEQNALRAVQRESLAYANGAKGNPGMVTKLTSKIPGIGPLVEDAMKSRMKGQMNKDLTKAAMGAKK